MKLWGGRFEKDIDALMKTFSSSLSFDRRLALYDLRVSEAHALALEECGVISAEERELIGNGLKRMKEEFELGKFPFADDEDIHTAVERVLVERLGETGAKLRAGRSRNDQVAADLKLYLMDTCGQICQALMSLMRALADQADANMGAVMPGLTHLQPAQPVLLSHHFLAFFEMFKRDVERLGEAKQRMSYCPLGSGALAGVTFSLDRGLLAEELGFKGITANSIDAVSERDFACDFLYCAAILAIHLSRLSDEIVLWSNPEFGFIRLDEAYATGSSMMPQKANPDVAELVRGKTGRITGHLMSLLMMLKGLPLAYNRDLQEDKEAIFDTIDNLDAMIQVLAGALASATFDAGKLKDAAGEGFTNATDLADYLVRKGLPFLEAHEKAGRLVRMCIDKGLKLEELPLEDYREVEPRIDEDLRELLTIDACIRARDLPGGTAPGRVEKALSQARQYLNKWGRA
ncbi:MAG: argininosuccinate lyase [Actinobacteria bacterium RBG_19FT_COMBO_54_7]|uniref:Argininosuccinate lyase n=1 Tax=Candidatus Solincola sediminis TaxID=1797199 RepID=A0A1F2WSR3_9ACTN|nr:MAG: argininosuccinate lyase [Candidatus Solincola sediminis]OFW60895.1 MAG: argininosuccinate lyase [Candidatus Solincola sediminis]OFW65336.1 MAG: argininosuccinate lyase [Actinobacteria bacterium RBG_19FT_COMBO_54_7]